MSKLIKLPQLILNYASKLYPEKTESQAQAMMFKDQDTRSDYYDVLHWIDYSVVHEKNLPGNIQTRVDEMFVKYTTKIMSTRK